MARSNWPAGFNDHGLVARRAGRRGYPGSCRATGAAGVGEAEASSAWGSRSGSRRRPGRAAAHGEIAWQSGGRVADEQHDASGVCRAGRTARSSNRGGGEVGGRQSSPRQVGDVHRIVPAHSWCVGGSGSGSGSRRPINEPSARGRRRDYSGTLSWRRQRHAAMPFRTAEQRGRSCFCGSGPRRCATHPAAPDEPSSRAPT